MSNLMTDMSQRDILKYFSLEKRKTLVKSIKGLRKMNTKVPLRLHTVDFDMNTVRIDDFRWLFAFDGSLMALYANPYLDNSNDPKYPLEMATCNGKTQKFKDYEPFLRFLNYYLNRKGTLIKVFNLMEAKFKSLPDFREVSIHGMQLEIKPGSYELWGKKFLEDFKDNQFRDAYIRDSDTDNKFMKHLKNMKIPHLVLFADEINDAITELNFPKMQVMEDGIGANGFDFLSNVNKFIDSNPDRKFMTYTVHSQDSMDFDWKEFRRRAKTELGATHRFRGYEGYLSIELINGREVQIWCKVVQFAAHVGNYYYLEAVFEDRKPSLTFNQLSVRNCTYALLNFYQVSIAQILQLHFMHRERVGIPRSQFTKECFFLYLNHHLRFLTFAGSFGFSRLVLWALPKIPSRNLSLLASTVFSIGVTWRAFRGYTYDCRKVAVLDIVDCD